MKIKNLQGFANPIHNTNILNLRILFPCSDLRHLSRIRLQFFFSFTGTCSPKLRGSVFSALSSAFWALNSLDKAIGYMQQDLVVAKSLNDISGECRAHGNLGAAQFSKGNFKEALTSHRYQLVLAMKCKDSQAAASALTSLGHVYTAIGKLI